MADLSEKNSSQTVKVVGADATGVETNFMSVDSDQRAQVRNPSEATNASAIPTISTLIGGSDGTNIRPLACDTEGRLVTSALTGFNADFSFGYVSTSATTKVAVRATAYTEPTTAAQRSIRSASANDASAGTGARTVRITYFDGTGAGPFTETVTLNGTTWVNTVATNIQFIEQIDIQTVGSGLTNAGIITMNTATGGGGTAIGTIAAGGGQTFWAHHYVAAGEEINITGVSGSHNGTTVGSGGLFELRAARPLTANSYEAQISDFIRLYGQSSNVFRSYQSPVKFTGFARITAYLTPETSSATIYRCSFDFFQP